MADEKTVEGRMSPISLRPILNATRNETGCGLKRKPPNGPHHRPRPALVSLFILDRHRALVPAASPAIYVDFATNGIPDDLRVRLGAQESAR